MRSAPVLVGVPTPGDVADVRTWFWNLVAPPFNFAPSDALGVLLMTRISLYGDFVRRGCLKQTRGDEDAFGNSILFWAQRLRAEMCMAGFWPELAYAPGPAFAHATACLHRWVQDWYRPAIVGSGGAALTERHGRLRALHGACRNHAVNVGQLSVDQLLAAAKGALRSAGLDGRTRKDVRDNLGLLQSGAKDRRRCYFGTRHGDLRAGTWFLRDASPELRKMRYHVRTGRAKPLSLDHAPSGDGREALVAETADTMSPDPGRGGTAEGSAQFGCVEQVFRQVCSDLMAAPLRKGADSVKYARRYLAAIRFEEISQAEVVRRHGLDKGNFSRIYHRELDLALAEARRRLETLGLADTP